MNKDEFLGVHYRAVVAFQLRPANTNPPGWERLSQCARDCEEYELCTEEQWMNQFVRVWESIEICWFLCFFVFFFLIVPMCLCVCVCVNRIGVKIIESID